MVTTSMQTSVLTNIKTYLSLSIRITYVTLGQKFMQEALGHWSNISIPSYVWHIVCDTCGVVMDISYTVRMFHLIITILSEMSTTCIEVRLWNYTICDEPLLVSYSVVPEPNLLTGINTHSGSELYMTVYDLL